jgi:hypothetical protein
VNNRDKLILKKAGIFDPGMMPITATVGAGLTGAAILVAALLSRRGAKQTAGIARSNPAFVPPDEIDAFEEARGLDEFNSPYKVNAENKVRALLNSKGMKNTAWEHKAPKVYSLLDTLWQERISKEKNPEYSKLLADEQELYSDSYRIPVGGDTYLGSTEVEAAGE